RGCEAASPGADETSLKPEPLLPAADTHRRPGGMSTHGGGLGRLSCADSPRQSSRDRLAPAEVDGVSPVLTPRRRPRPEDPGPGGRLRYLRRLDNQPTITVAR